jgi:hypothetical protein
VPPALGWLSRAGPFLPPFLVGVVLRLWGLGRQIIGGDELHAVREAMTRPLSELLVTYLPTDHCLPLSAFYRLLADAGVPLSETVLRLPVLAAGLALVAFLPPRLAPVLGRREAVVLAWLLAVAPQLVLWSRLIRSYAPMLFLAWLAVLAFERFLATGRRSAGLVYALAAALAVYFHLLAAPFVLAPLLCYLGERLRGREDLPGWGPVAAVGALTALGLCTFLIPGAPSLAEVLESKRGVAKITLTSVLGVLRLQSGVVALPLVGLFWGLLLRGAWRLGRARPRVLAYGATLVALQWLALLVLRPEGSAQPIILHRYLVVMEPALLAAVAVGVCRPWPRFPLRWGIPAGALLAAGLVAGGPLVQGGLFAGSSAHQKQTFEYNRERLALTRDQVPAAYFRLPEDGAILEALWHPIWRLLRSYPLYQEHHRREVLVTAGEAGLWDRALWDPRLAFRNMAPPYPAAMLCTRARYLFLHRELQQEEATVAQNLRRRVGGRDPNRRARWNRELESLDRQAAELARELTRRWGPPDLTEGAIQVWDLERVRAAAGGSATSLQRSRRPPPPGSPRRGLPATDSPTAGSGR